ncbi:hypothetical protein [Agrobacterium tumefaciens]|uniref:hypothetical protein n=1 Tax=Agrobacterium tumefaciens TaxID=358 RepID=UPI00157168DE|nr:hypothetical protein [Agrobacterium tumefaciens]NTD85461.1 hypothetical protein [Agrobacterium tumefaciens]NTD90810.1 hypothetical protein [Agrobacterium tumefaciens]NTE15884.1 hypothetical protein [Agrobacterium tumefaciens]NTE30508.1 hypothetical protein [Agrobacterium tumefaciens]NTE42701.1 hypothetical protein [Agrobacterium tumefaciens]
MTDSIPPLVQELQWYADKKRWPKGLAPLGGLLKRAIAALSAAEPVSSRNDEAKYVEFLNQDVPYIVHDVQGAVAILVDLETRNVIGYRVYDPDSVFAPPAPSVAVKALDFDAVYVIPREMTDDEWADVKYNVDRKANPDIELWRIKEVVKYANFIAGHRGRSALSAQVQDVADMPQSPWPASDWAIGRINELEAQAVREGWKLVPTEPTPEMIEAFADACWRKLQDTYGSNPTEEPEDGGGSIGYGYRAMLAAAPASTSTTATQKEQ